jgi:hypothetical protein
MTPTTALVPTILSIVIGALFGFVSEAVVGKVASKSATPTGTPAQADS